MLSELFISVNYGEIVSVLGKSGVGKSTLLRTIMHDLPRQAHRSKGRILVDNQDIDVLASHEGFHGAVVSMVFQNPSQIFSPLRTIGQHVSDFLEAHHVTDRYDEFLRQLEHLQLLSPERVMASYPFELSGGMLQRVAIGMAIFLRPALLLADEPTSALDVITQKEILDLLQQIAKQEQVAVLMITNNERAAHYVSDAIYRLVDGQCQKVN